MDMSDITAAIRKEIEARGTNPHRAAKDARLPKNSIRYVLDGHEPRAGRLIEICAALGLEVYVGPPRKAAAGARDADPGPIREQPPPYAELPARPLTAVRDRRLAELITALAEQWESLNETGRHALLTRFEAFFPDLREAVHTGRLVAWLGWRVMQRSGTE